MKLIRRNAPELPAARALAEWDPIRLWRDLASWEPFRELGAPIGRREPLFAPDFEVKETKDAYIFRADLPGVKEVDLEVRVTGMQLVVAGKREAEDNVENDTFHVYERSYGAFTRTFLLPDGADAEHIVAALKDGVLTLHVPKMPSLQPKKIPIAIKGVDH
jgi:HSP20 family protein